MHGVPKTVPYINVIIIHSTTFYSHSSTLVPPHFFPYLYRCQFLPFSQIFTMWTFYWRILRTLPFVLIPHHQANLSISQLVQHSHQFQLSLNQVHSLRWETLISKLASGTRSLHVSNCQKATLPCSWPYRIPNSDSGSQLASDRSMNVEPWYLRLSCIMPRPHRLICHHH